MDERAAVSRKEESSWPTEPQQQNNPEEDLELIPVWAVSSSPSPMLPDPSKYSSLRRLVRVTAWCRRFIRNSLQKVNKQPVMKGGLLVRELQLAEEELIRQCQWESFGEEIAKLKRGEELPRASKLLQLSPSLDGEGLLILKGRLDNLPEPSVTRKRPFILDGKHPFAQLLVMDLHQRSGHLGREYVVNEIRQHYWIIGIRSVVKKVWKDCQFCSNRRTKSTVPEMGQLPAIRLQQCSRPFTITGLDYFGPLEVTVGRSRQKRYGALFTCMTTRAVHVEVAYSLDTDSAIMAIRRFVGRRGSPTKLYSDNGTNFHGAERELRECLAEDDGPRNSWPLGRIIATYPGKDGQVRVVDVKTAKGTYRRPVVKIIPLNILEGEIPGSVTSKNEGEDDV
jgi:hypothetical protein